MKFRIDKLPKTEEDMEEIQREVEEEHEHEHHHEHEHSVEDLITDLYMSLQSLEGRVSEIEKGNEDCKKEIARLYKILSKLVLATLSENKEERIQNLKEIISLLE